MVTRNEVFLIRMIVTEASLLIEVFIQLQIYVNILDWPELQKLRLQWLGSTD